jgi:hypothetical protein
MSISKQNSLRLAAREAYIYALPLTEIANIRTRLLGAGIAAGQFHLQKGLATPADRFVTTPNNDTLYANAFIDLSKGPVTLTLPNLGERYGSLYLMDMYSNCVAVLGTRTTGQRGGSFTMAGPAAAAPSDALRSGTPWVWAMARVLVNGTNDVPDALAVLRQFRCDTQNSSANAAAGADRDGPWQDWMRAANALMLENTPFATDRNILQKMELLGLGSKDFDPKSFSDADAIEIAAGIAEAKKMTLTAGFGGSKIGEWLYPAANIGLFGQDYITRARIAVSGLAALPTAEAMYITAYSPDGSPAFKGNGVWRLKFAKDALPPVDSFWSLTMYELYPSGSLFLADNEMNRFSISDRTHDIRRDEDGGLSIWISRTNPGSEKEANWLPAPQKGPFVMIMRTYLPHADLVMQRYVPPSVESVPE